jgi:hypothetical protein
MRAGRRESETSRVYAALAGWQAGMLAVLVMLLWLGLASAWYQRSFWTSANIMASGFYGPSTLGRGFSWATLSGMAVYLILYSLFGALWGALMEGAFTRGRLVLFGILSGVAWYYLWFGLLWMHLNPLVTLYTHDRPMFWGHMLYGAMLGRFPVYRARLAPRPPQPGTPPESAAAPLEKETREMDPFQR